MTQPTIEHKSGATFQQKCTLEFDGTPVDITGWDISAAIKDRSGELVVCTTVAITDAANGAFTLSVADTSEWDGGVTYLMDILYSFNGTLMYSETMAIRVLNSITTEGQC